MEHTVSEPIVRLKPRKERPVLLGHPWIFSGAIADLDPSLEPGQAVVLQDAAGGFLARGYVNPRCPITIRLLTRVDEPIDATQCGGRENCKDERKCLTHDLWASLNEKIFDYLNSVTLAQLVAKAQAQAAEQKVVELKDQRQQRDVPEPAVPA